MADRDDRPVFTDWAWGSFQAWQPILLPGVNLGITAPTRRPAFGPSLHYMAAGIIGPLRVAFAIPPAPVAPTPPPPPG